MYPAGELPILGISGQTIVDALLKQGHVNATYEPVFTKLVARVGAMMRTGDLLVSLGAGNIHEVTTKLVRDLTLLEGLTLLLGEEGSAALYEPLSKHTTLRVGGPARFWAEPSTERALTQLVKFSVENSLPVLVMGRGSNLLVRDGGFDGLVIHPNGGEFARLDVNASTPRNNCWRCSRSETLSASAAAKAEIGGFEWMEGIPGAVGGSLRMNAGAMGVETFDQVIRLRVVNRAGEIREITPGDMEVQYRSVPSLEEQYAIAATFRGHASDASTIQALLLSNSTSKRKTSQPIAASAGVHLQKSLRESVRRESLFKNFGLKNARVGNARVSEVHGNFIVNDGGATAAEVLALIDQIKELAWSERGVRMTTEVQIIGQD